MTEMAEIAGRRAAISILRRRAAETEDAERQKKLLALAAKWEATVDESEWRHLDLVRM